MTDRGVATKIARWNMKAVISTVDIVRSESGMYVKYNDHIEEIARIRADAAREERDKWIDMCSELDAKKPAFHRSTYDEGYGDALCDLETEIKRASILADDSAIEKED